MNQNELQIFIFDKDELSGTLIENYLKEFSFSYAIHKYSTFDKNVFKSFENCNNFVFADINKDNTDILEDIAVLATNPKNIFCLMSSEPTTDLYIKALRAGLREFLRKPLEKESFVAAINNNYKENLSGSKTSKRSSKIIAVTSAESKSGKTFFAINTAAELAYTIKDKVLLIDLNDNLNNVTYTLDIDYTYDTEYFVEHTNEENVKSMLDKLYKYGNLPLYVLSGCMYRANSSSSLSPENFQSFLNIVKKYFRYVVVDINADSDEMAKIVFNNTDMIFYIISSNFAANMKNKVYINKRLDKKNFRVIVNNYKAKDEAKLAEIENAIERVIFYKIPTNLSITLGSNGKGKTVREINENLDVVTKYNKLAKYIINRV